MGELVAGTLSGTLHYQKTVGNVTEHRTAAVTASFFVYQTGIENS